MNTKQDMNSGLAQRGLLQTTLDPFLPAGAGLYVAELLADHAVVVRVSRPRRTKLGDHRSPRRQHPFHRISVNDNLNPYAFLTTLLHEIAHLTTWEKYHARSRRIKPHGHLWQQEFERIVSPIVGVGLLPEDIACALKQSILKPSAATCSDRTLLLALARYDQQDPSRTRVEQIASGAIFRIDSGKTFRKGPKVRSRYQCFECPTGREYRVHALSLVELVEHLPSGPSQKPEA